MSNNKNDNNINNQLFTACQQPQDIQDIQHITSLLQHNATITVSQCETVLKQAVLSSNDSLLSLLLDNSLHLIDYSPFINHHDEDGLPLLYYACQVDNVDALKLLIQAKANIGYQQTSKQAERRLQQMDSVSLLLQQPQQPALQPQQQQQDLNNPNTNNKDPINNNDNHNIFQKSKKSSTKNTKNFTVILDLQ